jgi:hypothetical protein
MCPNTPWARTFPAQAERLCREYGLGGLYYDFTFPYRCDAAHHPCGSPTEVGAADRVDAARRRATTEGSRRGEFRIFALRKLAQETYERVKAVREDTRILMHTSGALMYPYIGFADLMLNGEQLRQPLTKSGGHYMDVLPLEALRAEYRGEHAGLAPFFIPEFASPEGLPDPGLTDIPGPTNEMLALTLLHDIGVWPIYCHLPGVEAVVKAQQEFGIAEAGFIPYWDRGGPVVMTAPHLLASAWIRPAGLLLVVANRGRAASQTRVRLRGRLGRHRVRGAADALTAETLPLSDKGFSLSVPARSFRLVRLQPSPVDGRTPTAVTPRSSRR